MDWEVRVVHGLEDVANGREGKGTDLDQRPDQAQSTDVLAVVVGLVRRGGLARREETFTAVELDRRDRYTGSVAELRDPHALPSGVDSMSG